MCCSNDQKALKDFLKKYPDPDTWVPVYKYLKSTNSYQLESPYKSFVWEPGVTVAVHQSNIRRRKTATNGIHVYLTRKGASIERGPASNTRKIVKMYALRKSVIAVDTNGHAVFGTVLLTPEENSNAL